MKETAGDVKFHRALRSISPGTPLREGLEHVLRAKTGALIVVSDLPAVMELVDGGFAIECEYSPAHLYELAKMDGAIVLSQDGKKIRYANVHLVPNSSIPSAETGTRHRTAERVAKQTGELVIAISQRRNLITIWQGSNRYTLRDTAAILSKANQALQTLDKYKKVLNQSLVNLTALEFEDLVTLNEVAGVLQHAIKVLRIFREIERYILELGADGRLISMQLEELMGNIDDSLLVIRDYCITSDQKTADLIREQITALHEELPEPMAICRLLGFGSHISTLDLPVVPRGYRVLKKIVRIPMPVIENLVQSFRTLHRISNTTISELDDVEGIGEVRARAIKDGLKRIREQALLDRYI
ncbi:MAG TPA: DNA integrity scanning diadenylate cyclase DisA [Negativicutes bacterium]|nr:DNA integrity scanning diadenylate cyclase DisA [Negativicutes bacterium]